jgi:signal peptidase complex subunit 1
MEAILDQARTLWEGEIVRPVPLSPLYQPPHAPTPPISKSPTPRSSLPNILQDFAGQRLAESLTYVLLTLTGIAAFLAGFSTQNIHHILYLGLGGTALTFLVVVPPWPFFNQKPLPWLPARSGAGAGLQGVEIEVDGKKVR